MNLSEHFTIEELEFSQTATRLGLDNRIPPDLMANAMFLCVFMEQIRAILAAPVEISSGYRSPALNAAVPGSASRSAHTQALACDFTSKHFGSAYAVASRLINSGLRFDQIVYEGTWVHASPQSVDGAVRNEVLTAKFYRGAGKPDYLHGLID
jgi:zinc D-Ala-D-Ala carboxypeptidase